MSQVFEGLADAYDGWYDSPEGGAVFRAERECLRSVWDGPFDAWLEVGVGTGRFAQALGVGAGVDPSPDMLAIAASRGVATAVGEAERLPFAENAFEGALLALALCFVADASETLRECRRVLRPSGRLLLGIVPSDSPWGRSYMEKAARGHPIYSHARFRTATETLALAEQVGFARIASASALFWGPEEEPERTPRVESGVVSGAGFVALLLGKTE